MIEPQLQRLEHSELIRRLHEAELEYLFRHALVQETARASLLHQDRKRLHRFVGETLEELYPERRADLAPLLAQHFSEAGNDAKTLEYAELSGDGAARVNAHAEALRCYTNALTMAQHLNASAKLQELYLKRGRVLEIKGDFHAALDNYAALQNLGATRGEPAMELAAIMACATIHSIPSVVYDAARAQALSDRALALARALDDKAAQATILWNLMLLHSRVGKGFQLGAQYGEQALQIARENGLREREAYLLNDLSPLLVFHGETARGVQYNLQARAMWRELDNLPMLSSNLGYAIMNHITQGEYESAITTMHEALTLSREIGNEWNEAFAQTWTGEAYIELGELAAAERVMHAAIALGERAFPPTLVMTRARLARFYADLGDAARGVALAEQALAVSAQRFPSLRWAAVGALVHTVLADGQRDRARELLQDAPDLIAYEDNPWHAIDLGRAQIEYALAAQDYSQTVRHADALWAYQQQDGIAQDRPIVLLLRARAQRGLENFDAAANDLAQAQEIAAAQKSQWALWQIFAERAKLEAARGDVGCAEKFRADARAFIEFIAARAPLDYRARFLERALSEL